MNKFRKIYSFILFSMLLWLLYSALIFPAGSYDYLAGIIFAPITLVFALKISSPGNMRYITPQGFIWIIAYIPYLFMRIVQANIDVALRVLHPKLPIKPGFIKIDCSKTPDSFTTLMLANSITLTPGTLTVDTEGNKLFIHTVDTSQYEKGGDITEGFMHYLKRV